MKIIFNDNLTIKTLENGKITEYPCDFYNNYVKTVEKMAKSQEWKYNGAGATFRGDSFNIERINTKNSYYTSLDCFGSYDKVLFTVTINEVSGIFIKDLSVEKDSESHVIHSHEHVFSGSCPNHDLKVIATSLKEDYVTAHLAIFNLETNDLSTLTDGDCYDFDPCYSKTNPSKILFASKGVGRDVDGDFVEYSNSSILRYDLNAWEIEELFTDENCSLEKPRDDKFGNYYYIEKPKKERKSGFFRTLLDIILIPYRILEAFVSFIEIFTSSFTGKSLVKTSNSGNVKKKNKTKGEIFIEGNLINVDKEYKNNLKHKDKFAGYVPRAWKLVKVDADGNKIVLATSVIDYVLLDDGSIVYTNGKHVLLVKDGKTEKLADTSMCTQVAVF
ncbi:MAG: hypothetical protein IJW64_04775 [Clostridia bacterium]|nr:hypothetical protein [Clostridia bacterium]